jgi:hypothetical protein
MKNRKTDRQLVKLIFKTFCILLFTNSILFCFGQDAYYTTTNVNLRSAPSVSSNVVVTLPKNIEVSLIEKTNAEWYYVTVQDYNGYVSSRFIALQADPYADWEKKDLKSGETPECENINPEYDYNLDNYLEVNVGQKTDVVVKLMKMTSTGDKCIRMIYVRGGESHQIKNVPGGEYYLKIAYGRDFRKKKVGDHCEVKFLKNAHYEKGKDSFSFNLVEKNGKIMIPYFEIFLDVVESSIKNLNNLNSKDISEKEFNN